MPPSLPRSSLSSLTRCKCSTTSILSRNFSTSISRSSIGPENPKFISVPLPPQRFQRLPRDIKGTLPPPRNLFPPRSADKTSPEYLAAATLEPKATSEPMNDYVAWKRRMAASRRTNLREGLLDLHKRKVRQDMIIANVSKGRRRERERRLHAPQREDERLTSPTITAAISKLQLGPVPDPDRAARVAAKAARVQAKEAMREEQRRNALHTLYMHAREFITTEEQLDEEIEKIFGAEPFGKDKIGKDNVWEAYGPPPTVQDMLSTVNNTQKAAMQYHAGPAAITGKRIKRIAEELTGGKMD